MSRQGSRDFSLRTRLLRSRPLLSVGVVSLAVSACGGSSSETPAPVEPMQHPVVVDESASPSVEPAKSAEPGEEPRPPAPAY